MDFENQVKLALAQQGKDLLRSQVDKAYAAYRPAQRVNMIRQWAAAAAIALLVVAAGWWIQTAVSHRPEYLFSQYFDPTVSTQAREGIIGNRSWEKALSDYDQKKYKVAVESFRATLADRQFPRKDAANLYLGLSLLADRRPAEAREAFMMVREESILKADAQWFAALSALAEKNIPLAQTLLTAIAEDNTHHQQDKAALILTRLR